MRDAFAEMATTKMNTTDTVPQGLVIGTPLPSPDAPPVRLTRIERGPMSTSPTPLRTAFVEGLCNCSLSELAVGWVVVVWGAPIPGVSHPAANGRMVTTSPIAFIESRDEQRAVFETQSGSRYRIEALG